MADHHSGIPLISIPGPNKFSLNETALERLLLRKEVKDLPVAVISVAGAFNKGKSFLLDFFLRYANHQYGEAVERDIWIGNDGEPLIGFPWSGGSSRSTTGILIWSKLFVCTTSKNGNVCVILIDTQGIFDGESTVQEWATVFAISTMISSVQIYNLSQNIQEDDLQHLELFIEYGRLAQSKTGRKPFQKLLFLVRDWSYPYEHGYGAIGGKELLEKRLKTKDDQHVELQNIRRNIKSCFEQIDCFLMPHPGLKVASDPMFNGSLADIDPIFRAKLKELIRLVMTPANLVVKRVHGEVVTTKDLLTYLKKYVAVFNSGKLPEPKSLFMATAEANNLSAAADALDTYNKSMSQPGVRRVYVNETKLRDLHVRSKETAMQAFIKKPKIGSPSFSEVYKQKLESDIERSYKLILATNENRNIFALLLIPAKLILLAILCNILSTVASIFGLKTFSWYVSMVGRMAILLVLTWVYYQYRKL
ncbi:Guanylate-Hypothetical protein protein, N-terminal domain [Nesidiocoris tenuis]|uniref:GB1/RHD3-type G domain-containing protein n=1 Tax=Nesidiocoris tenuis TaxID=355587 RepID=A0ABN7AY89_9HEMI|nr:Guanylate-Hypothetical protein protein, N-terminal domain [Nesidiocoris tenuis]